MQPGVHEVGVQSGAREHTDARAGTIGVVSRVLEGFVRQLQQDAVLRIHRSRFHWRVAEESGIKMTGLVQNGSGLHITRVSEVSGRDA
jgi:hypothetical protein